MIIMRSAIEIILLDFVVWAHAKDPPAQHTVNTQDFVFDDSVTDQLVNKILERTLEVWPVHSADLEKTTLGKGGSLPRAPHAAHQPQIVSSFMQALPSAKGTSISAGRLPHISRGTILSRSSTLEGQELKQVPVQGSFPRRPTPLLNSLNDEGPQKVRRMNNEQLQQLADEVRWQVLDAVSVTGGHLGSALGVVELTVALHHVFDTPRDEICWDVAHQVYPHKVLTGRRNRIYTLRQGGGLSGFTKRTESPYDSFGAGHSGTSISAAVGFQIARDVQRQPGHAVAVIGDGAITGGMAWEAINHAGGLGTKVLVILNDNGQVSLPTYYNKVRTPVGALSQTLAQSSTAELGVQSTLARMETSEQAQNFRQVAKAAAAAVLPGRMAAMAGKLDEYGRDFIHTVPFAGSGTEAQVELFESLGFYYVGPIDGHDMETLTTVMGNLKKLHEDDKVQKPILLHVKTQKGKGYIAAEDALDKLHAAKPNFNLQKESDEGVVPVKKSTKSFTQIFGEQLVKEGEKDPKIVAITAAMPGGTGVSIFENRFGPSRTFDVGIAEQHAVTLAAGMVAGGLKPFCCIYSTFLQRGYDQVVHDVALQNLPVRFVIDRAGLVGADGPTHGGSFDLSFLACIPNMKICAPSDEAELVHMVHTIAMIDDSPTAVRYPRGSAYGDVELPETPEFLQPGKGRIVREGKGGTLAILSIGSRLRESLAAADRLEGWGISATVADARWVKPLDRDLILSLAKEHRALITIEENSIGGFGSQVQQLLFDEGVLDGWEKHKLVLRSMTIPDRWIAADDPKKQYDDAELNSNDIVTKALSALSRTDVKVSDLADVGKIKVPVANQTKVSL